jgi:hypothetical protein
MMTHNPREVVVRLNGGLGNQMFQYAYGLAISYETGAQLSLDHSLFSLTYTPEDFRLIEFDMDLRLISNAQCVLNRLLLSTRVPLTLRRILLQSLRVAVRTDTEQVGSANPKQLLCAGYFQQAKNIELIVGVLREKFKMPPLSPAAASLLSEIREFPSVAMHFRRGDYASIPKFRDTLGVLSTNYYREAADQILLRVPKARFFVFSDDPQWCYDNVGEFLEDYRIITHSDDRSDMDDLQLMMGCDHFVVANSTFSWWAAFLANGSDKIVVGPDPWFRDPTINVGMLVSSWGNVAASWEQ